jgi:hypothetical protein
MMRSSLVHALRVWLVAVAAAGAPALWAQPPTSARMAEIQAELAWLADPMLFPYELSGRSRGAVLEIVGQVPTESLQRRAVDLARAATRAGDVRPPIVNPSLSHSWPSQSPTLADDARKALGEVVPKYLASVHVSANHEGELLVTGVVGSDEDRLAVSRRLRQVHGCTAIANRLTVRANVPVWRQPISPPPELPPLKVIASSGLPAPPPPPPLEESAPTRLSATLPLVRAPLDLQPVPDPPRGAVIAASHSEPAPALSTTNPPTTSDTPPAAAVPPAVQPRSNEIPVIPEPITPKTNGESEPVSEKEPRPKQVPGRPVLDTGRGTTSGKSEPVSDREDGPSLFPEARPAEPASPLPAVEPAPSGPQWQPMPAHEPQPGPPLRSSGQAPPAPPAPPVNGRPGPASPTSSRSEPRWQPVTEAPQAEASGPVFVPSPAPLPAPGGVEGSPPVYPIPRSRPVEPKSPAPPSRPATPRRELPQPATPAAGDVQAVPAEPAKRIDPVPAPAAGDVHSSPAPAAERIGPVPGPATVDVDSCPTPAAEHIRPVPAPAEASPPTTMNTHEALSVPSLPPARPVELPRAERPTPTPPVMPPTGAVPAGAPPGPAVPYLPPARNDLGWHGHWEMPLGPEVRWFGYGAARRLPPAPSPAVIPPLPR